MKLLSLSRMAFAGVVFAAALLAQTSPVAKQQTLTTGMVGLSSGQTARINVLNLNTPPILTPVSSAVVSVGSCAVTMEFFDAQNKLLNSFPATVTVAPQNAVSLDLAWAALPPSPSATGVNALRREIRGVVIAAPVTSSTTASTTACSLKVALEVYENSTGGTVFLTSDTSVQ